MTFFCIVVFQDVLFFEILTFSFAKLFVKPVFSWIETSGDQTKLNQTPQDQSPPTNHKADPNTLDVSNNSKQSQDVEAPVTADTNATSKAEAAFGPKGKFLIY